MVLYFLDAIYTPKILSVQKEKPREKKNQDCMSRKKGTARTIMNTAVCSYFVLLYPNRVCQLISLLTSESVSNGIVGCWAELMTDRGAPYPEFCCPAVSGSMSDPNRILITWIRLDLDPNLDYCRQQEKNYSFCTTTGRN